MAGDGFVEVGRTADFPENRGRAVDLDGKKVAVFRVGDRWFAIQDSCPHMGASLADGVVVDNKVVCDWHSMRFDLVTGAGDNRSGACAAIYRVRTAGDRVWLKPPAKPGPPAPADEPWVGGDPNRFFKKKE